MPGARVGLAVGLALSAVAAAIVLSSSPPVLAGTNGVIPVPYPPLTSVPGGGGGCQADEAVPGGTSAVRLSLEASAGPRVSVAVWVGGRAIARGVSAQGWLGRVVTVPIVPLVRTVHHATVCFSFAGAEERVSLLGVRTPPRSAARSSTRTLPGRIAVEYLRPGSSSWWSLAPSVARRMGLGRAWAGTWVAAMVALLMATGIVLASWLTLRESR
ncbi:MAG TPA: hypothetical protein VG147_10160 [Solirubrobacteraceae bacterium]|jgi:hypothetical protein|nr:hypothetical protein [Solirubrobacteraceae bacterium]